MLDRLDELGVGLEVDGDRLRVLGISVVPRDLREEMRAERDELIEQLRADEEEHRPSEGRAWIRCDTCGWIGGGPVDRIQYLAENHRAIGHRVRVRR